MLLSNPTNRTVESDASEVLEELLNADGLLLGTPTILGEALKPIWELTLSMFPVTHGGKYAGRQMASDTTSGRQ